jgi:hypothetical protein
MKRVSPSDCAVPMRPFTSNPNMNARSLCRSSKTSPLHMKQIARPVMLFTRSFAILKLSPRRLGLLCPTPYTEPSYHSVPLTIAYYHNQKPSRTYPRDTILIHHGRLRIETRPRAPSSRPTTALRQPQVRPMGTATTSTRRVYATPAKGEEKEEEQDERHRCCGRRGFRWRLSGGLEEKSR